MAKAVVVFSGGPDSTAAALWASQQGADVELLTFRFHGAEQEGEISAANDVAQLLARPQSILDFQSPLTAFSGPIQILMHAGDTEARNGDRRLLPFGAGMVLSVASAWALDHGAAHVVWGATKDDASGSPQYGEDFAREFAAIVAAGVGEAFMLSVPFADLHKPEVFAVYREKRDLFARTWSCKLAGSQQCGNCEACMARRISAHIAGIDDGTTYGQKEFAVPHLPGKEPAEFTDPDWESVTQQLKSPKAG